MKIPAERMRRLNRHVMESTVGLFFFILTEHEPIADPLGLDALPTPENGVVVEGSVVSEKSGANGTRKTIQLSDPLPSPPDGTWWVTAAKDASGAIADGAVPGRLVDDEGVSVTFPTSGGSVSMTIHVSEGAP